MKKYILIAAMIAIPATANAGMLMSAMSAGWPTKQAAAKYKLDAIGFDLRIYEWIPKDNPNVRCLVVAGNQNSTGVSCYNVKEK